jgi:hypothetical protein
MDFLVPVNEQRDARSTLGRFVGRFAGILVTTVKLGTIRATGAHVSSRKTPSN